MQILEKLPLIIGNCKRQAEDIINKPYINNFIQKEKIISCPNKIEAICKKNWVNQFYQEDNIMVMKKLIEDGYKEKIDLIYIDPPFLTKTKYKGRILLNNGEREDVIEYFAYNDTWENGLLSYLEMLCIRLLLMKELLSNQGTIYVHLDYRTVHYVKLFMDQIFGEENFLNEIIWAYKSGGASPRNYSRKHDNILVYTKGKNYIFNPQLEKSYNRDFKPYRFKGVKEYEDDIGWYTLVNLKDVWKIDMVGRTSKERVGYDTQKPEKLLERIILTSSNEESIVADFFAGSGTTGVVAEKFNRKWIMADSGSLSSITISKRLIGNKSSPYYICKTYKNHIKAGKLLIKEIEIRKNKKGSKELYMELDRYELSLNQIHIKDKYKNKIKTILSKESLSLIDYIGIDTDYDGNTPIIHWQYYKNKDGLNIHSNFSLQLRNIKKGQKIYIKYVDIFGHGNSNLYEIRDERVILCQED
ncbi:DNA methyltransferase [Clostridium sp. Cult2]|uniref:DNA methyltransferase n=1 Tax=Clostridium sp. Cult2 TaxID=2079003 RepID=UPI001F399E9C|nr:site-specific DNA-methyltransferase [Clostridium sp. Cult2]MCF6465751.1 hypothetical protein [Clostridium sp. Cult2]